MLADAGRFAALGGLALAGRFATLGGLAVAGRFATRGGIADAGRFMAERDAIGSHKEMRFRCAVPGPSNTKLDPTLHICPHTTEECTKHELKNNSIQDKQ